MKHDAILSAETGQSLLIQTLVLIPLLVLLIGLVYDLGAVAVVQARLQDAADLAVQDAAKTLSYAAFWDTQEIRLAATSGDLAAQRLAEYSQGQAYLAGLYMAQPDNRHTALYLVAEAKITTPFLRLIGIPTVIRRARAVAVPAFGIGAEGE